MTPNELVLTFGGLHLCVKFGENRERNATVRVMTTDRQTDTQTHRQTQTDFIICRIAICYSYGTDNKHLFLSANSMLYNVFNFTMVHNYSGDDMFQFICDKGP